MVFVELQDARFVPWSVSVQQEARTMNAVSDVILLVANDERAWVLSFISTAVYQSLIPYGVVYHVHLAFLHVLGVTGVGLVVAIQISESIRFLQWHKLPPVWGKARSLQPTYLDASDTIEMDAISGQILFGPLFVQVSVLSYLFYLLCGHHVWVKQNSHRLFVQLREKYLYALRYSTVYPPLYVC